MLAPCIEIIDDIEDLVSSLDVMPKDRYSSRSGISIRVKRKKKPIIIEAEESKPSLNDLASSVIPGTQKIFMKTWGCTHNTSDSEYMGGLLASYGYKLTDDKMEADLWLLNSCTVKNPAEDHFRNEIDAGQRNGKFVVVAGCVPQGAPKANYLKGLSVIGVQQIDRVVEVVEETLKGHSVRLFGQKKTDGRKSGGASLALPKIRKNPLIEIIPINTGCLNQCTYCKTKHARGDLGSYPPEEIVARAQQSFSEGVCELWLTSEDTGTYGRDIGSSLPELLWKIIEVVPPNCMIRVGMTNPPYILEHLEEMGKILAHPHVYSFLHVPVQSGSDSVLGDMKREYCRADFETVVDVLRDRVPGVNIATDIICGFPTETDEDFEETLDLCQKYKFNSLFINQFYPRPGTPAARMPRVPAVEVKKRTKKITELFRSYELFGSQIGTKQDVLITEEAYDGQHLVGHNKYYHQVLVDKDPELLGKMVQVEIISAGKFFMTGRIIHVVAQVSKPQITKNHKNVEYSHKIFSLLATLFVIFVLLIAFVDLKLLLSLGYCGSCLYNFVQPIQRKLCLWGI